MLLPRTPRFRSLRLLSLLGALAMAAACSPGTESELWLRARQLDYLRHATEVQAPNSLMNAAAHMELARRRPWRRVTPGAVTLADQQAALERVHSLADTSDFRILEIVFLLYRYREVPRVARMLTPELWDALEETVLGFKYWYTDPTPFGIVDDMWYWSENHEIIFHVDEYLAGQLFPDRVFAVSGLTGAEHRERAHARIVEWMDHRARFGFFEWHSNVYWKFCFQPLLALAELGDDAALARRAAAFVDVLLYDLALNSFRGSYGVTHGRTYKKDKMTALHENTFSLVELLFDQQDEHDYTSRGDLALQLVASLKRYRPPRVLRAIARSEQPLESRQRMGIVFDEHEPIVPGVEPVHPYGFSYTDPELLPLWWSMSNLTAWQLVPLSIDAIETYDLWETEGFQEFGDLSALRNLPVAALVNLASVFSHSASMALLKEVNTYTYRTADYMMSSAQDYRKGSRSNQAHIWQVSFDADAMVMTSQPGHPPRQTTDWRDDGQPGQWTGTASIPRVGQHQNVAIQIYAPQYAFIPAPPLDSVTSQEPYTHAYLPQDHFDEVVRDGNWTFARFRDGYLALYSWRPPEYVSYDPAVVATNGMLGDFDLRAPGGAHNVWIAECGSREQWGSFAAFRAAIDAASVSVTPVEGDDLPEGVLGPVFEVEYDSPSQGTLRFGWQGPLEVQGAPVEISGYPRFDNASSHVPFESGEVLVWDAPSRTGFYVDLFRGRRLPFGRPSQPGR